MIATNTLYEAIKKELGSLNLTNAHGFNDYIRYINSGVRYICQAYNFPFNEYSYDITTNGTDTSYNIPYQIETYFILNSGGDEVDFLTFKDYYREKDKSNKICIKVDKLITPMVGDFEIFYRGYPELITELTGNIDVPEPFYDALVLASIHYGFMDVKAYDKANYKKGVLDGLLKSLAKRESDKQPLKTKRMNKSQNNSNIW